MKTWFNLLVLASLVLSQFAAPVSVGSAPAIQEGETGTATVAPTASATLSATATPESETPVPTRTDEPTFMPSETPSPAATASATGVPSEARVSKINLVLGLEPDHFTPRGRALLQWAIEGLGTESKGLSLQFRLPEGLIPEVPQEGAFNETTGLLGLPVAGDQGEFGLQAQDTFKGAPITAVLLEGATILTEAILEAPVREEYEVTRGGGKIEARGGRVRLTFPEDLFMETARVQIGAPGEAERPAWSLSGQPFDIQAQGAESGSKLSRFDREVVIEVEYDPEEYQDGMGIYWYNPETHEWEALRTEVDRKQNLLRAETNHFSVFDTGVNQWESARMPSVESFQVSDFTGAGTFSLPIEVPAGPGGLQPSLTLSYNSQVVDQSMVNTQASWVGMGWSLETGSITRESNDTEHLDDDTFHLNVAGVSTRIVRGSDWQYHAGSENFWRFSFNASANTWTVWDKTGNIYYFEKTSTLNYLLDCDNAEVPGGATAITYQWSLTRVWNIFSNAAQQLTYTYASETKALAGEEWIGGKCRATSYTTETAVYPQTIVYPNNRYRIYFETEPRTDYTISWTWDALHHDFQRSRLKNIHIQYTSTAGSFVNPVTDSSQTVRRYQFIYESDPAKVIYAGFTYSAGGKVTTLAGVKEYGAGNDGTGLPANTFVYGDNLRLTRALNGYDGEMQYSYDTIPASFSATTAGLLKTKADCFLVTWRPLTGADYVDFNCDPYSNNVSVRGTAIADNLLTQDSRMPMVRPGGWYVIWVNTAGIPAGSSLQIGLSDGSTTQWSSALTAAGWQAKAFILPAGASQVRPMIRINGSQIVQITGFMAGLFPSFYRVTSKAVLDGRGHTYTSTYSYSTAAINTSTNSDVCAPNELDCKSIVEANSEFRGHASVTVTGPDGRKTTTNFTQADANAGQPSSQLVTDAGGKKFQETVYAWTSTDQGLWGLPAGYTKWGFVHNWLRPAYTESRTYNNAGTAYTATRRNETYEATYGNLIASDDQTGSGSTWTTYRTTAMSYFPYVNSSVYLTGLPAQVQVRNTAGSVLSDTLNLYDSNNVYNAMPTAGKLTAQRTWVGGAQYSQVSYGYDRWGNVTTTTGYTGYGTYSTAPTVGSQTSYTCYGSGGTLGGTACTDDGVHTFPLWSKNALGHITNVSYDYTLGVPTSETDPNGAVTSATYDNFGRITGITRPLDSAPTLSMTYQDSFPFTTTITQRVDASNTFALTRKYDGMGRNYETTAGGIVTTTSYDGYGRAVWQSVPGGSEGTTTSYDVLGRPLSVTAPDGTVTAYSYNGLTTTLTEPDANGGTHNTTTTADVWGRTLSVSPPTGPGVTYTYDELDRLKTAVRGGLTTTLTYDSAGRKLSMNDPDMGYWTYGYDALGNLTTQTDARACTVAMSYDPLNRLTGKASSGAGCGTQVTTGYTYDAGTDSRGRRTGMTDASGSTSWSYDARGRLTSESKTITGGGTFITGWAYNSADLPVSTTYPDGEIVTSGYNARMLLDSLSGTSNYVTGTTYDAAGRVTARNLGNGLAQGFTYYPWNTQGGRLQTISVGTIQNLNYSYDAAGNITSIINPIAGETQSYGYDALDRLTQWRVNGNLSGQYGYDPLSGNLTSKGTTRLGYEESGNPGTAGLAAWWSLDETSGTRADSHAGNTLTDNNTVGYTTGVKGNAASFIPANAESLSAADNPALSLGDLDFTVKAHVYLNSAASSMLIAVKGNKGDLNQREFNLSYNQEVGGRFLLRVGNGTTTATVQSEVVQAGRWYTLIAWHDAAADTLNIQVDNGTVYTTSYSGGSYDSAFPLAVGAFSDGTYVLDGKVDELALWKRVLNASERTWLYNNGQGRRYGDLVMRHAVRSAVTAYTCPQGEVCDHDQAQTGVNNTYGYDANGNQTTRTINGVTVTLGYDAEGHLVSVTGQGINATFTYDGDGRRVAQTINGVTTYFVGNYYEVTGSVITKYYYAGSQRVAMREGNAVYYLLSDHLGSTSLTTDSNGNVVSEMRYSAWGSVRYSSGTTPTDYTFTGQYSDSYINLLDYVSRRYDPYLNHFTQPDTIVPDLYNSQDWDRYSYARNNPLRYTDPSGHRPCGDGEGVNCTTGLLNNPRNNPNKGCRAGECLGITHNPCLMRRFTCEFISTDPAGITPSLLPGVVIGTDEFTDFGPENPPTVNGQTFTPAYGSIQRGAAIAELLMMGFEFLHYGTGFYSSQTGSSAQGVIPVVHDNTSGRNIIPGVGIYNNTGYYLRIGVVTVNDVRLDAPTSPVPNGSMGVVKFTDPVTLPTTSISVVIDFQAVQSTGVMFGYGQVRYNGPNYFPIYGPPAP